MACNKKLMVTLVIGLSFALITLNGLLPGFREAIAGLSPLLIAAICPLMMFFCMKHMNRQNKKGESDVRSRGGDALLSFYELAGDDHELQAEG
jgi:hypothetical protein